VACAYGPAGSQGAWQRLHLARGNRALFGCPLIPAIRVRPDARFLTAAGHRDEAPGRFLPVVGGVAAVVFSVRPPGVSDRWRVYRGCIPCAARQGNLFGPSA